MARNNRGPQPVLYGPDTRHGAKVKKGLRRYVWHAVWYESGSRRIRSLDVEHGGDYQAAFREVVAEWAADKPVNDLTEVTVARALELYLIHHGQYQPSARSLMNFATVLTRSIGHIAVSQLTDSICREYAATRTANTARAHLKTLTSALRYCASKGLIPSAPPIWKPPPPPAKDRTLSRKEIAAIVRILRKRATRHYAIAVLIQYHCGQRAGAVMTLRWSPNRNGGHVDLERGLITFNAEGRAQTSKRRPTIPIPRGILPLLRALHRKGSTHVIGAELQRASSIYARAFQKACVTARVRNATPHALRHTRITEMVSAGIAPAIVASFVGADVVTIMRTYAHLIPGHMHSAATFRPTAR